MNNRIEVIARFIITVAVILTCIGCGDDIPKAEEIVVIVKPNDGGNDGGIVDAIIDNNVSSDGSGEFPDGYIDPPDRCRPLVYSRDCFAKAVDGLPIIHCTDGVAEVYPACTVYHPETHQAIAYCKPECGKVDGGGD